MKELKKYKKAWNLWEEWVKQEDVCNAQNFCMQVTSDGEYLVVDCKTSYEDVKEHFSMLYGILLEFLDKQDIIVSAERNTTSKFTCTTLRVDYESSIFDGVTCINRHLGFYAIFSHAQKAAVNEAFELLEKRLEG